jgi:DNA-damage-inducible protein D
VEFWYARELQNLLGYNRWENFENTINKAKMVCENAKQNTTDHFRGVTKTIPMPKEDIKKLERKLKSEDKKLPKNVKKLN